MPKAPKGIPREHPNAASSHMGDRCVAATSLRCCGGTPGDQDGRGTNELSKIESILGTRMSQNLSRDRRLAWAWAFQKDRRATAPVYALGIAAMGLQYQVKVRDAIGIAALQQVEDTTFRGQPRHALVMLCQQCPQTFRGGVGCPYLWLPGNLRKLSLDVGGLLRQFRRLGVVLLLGGFAAFLLGARFRCPPWRAKRRRVVPGSREATRDTRRAEGAKGDPKGASERGVQSYGRPVCSRNELAMLWRNAG